MIFSLLLVMIWKSRLTKKDWNDHQWRRNIKKQKWRKKEYAKLSDFFEMLVIVVAKVLQRKRTRKKEIGVYPSFRTQAERGWILLPLFLFSLWRDQMVPIALRKAIFVFTLAFSNGNPTQKHPRIVLNSISALIPCPHDLVKLIHSYPSQ